MIVFRDPILSETQPAVGQTGRRTGDDGQDRNETDLECGIRQGCSSLAMQEGWAPRDKGDKGRVKAAKEKAEQPEVGVGENSSEVPEGERGFRRRIFLSGFSRIFPRDINEK